MHKMTAAVLVFAGWGIFGSHLAHAQATRGAFQLGLGTDIVAHSSATATIKTPLRDQEAETSTTQWGLGARKTVNLEAGYGITDSIVFGGLLSLGGISQKVETVGVSTTQEVSTFDLLLAPKLDFMFLPGGRVRPYLGVAAGLVITNQHTRASRLNAVSDDTETSLTGFGLMGRAGIRWFAAPGFSLDPAVVLNWQTASGEYKNGAITYDASGSGWGIGLALAASGWIG